MNLSIFNFKRILPYLLLIIAIILCFIFFKSWYQGKVITQRMNEVIEEFNKKDKIKIKDLKIEEHLFSKEIQFTMSDYTTQSEIKLLSAKYRVSHGPLVGFIQRKQARLEGDIHFYAITPPRKLAWLSYLNGAPMSNYLISALLSKEKNDFKSKSDINISHDNILSANFSFRELGNVFNEKLIELNELNLAIIKNLDDKSQEDKGRIIMTIPSFKFHLNHQDWSDNYAELTSEVANVIKPKNSRNDTNIETQEVEVAIEFDNNSLTHIQLGFDTLQVNHFSFEKVLLDLKNSINNDKIPSHISDLAITFKSDDAAYKATSLGQLLLDFEFNKLDIKTLKTILSNAHIRYNADLLTQNNKFTLPVYYFAQWINYSGDFLTSKPQFKLNKFELKTNEKKFMSSQQLWDFSLHGPDYSQINQHLFLLPLLYVDDLSIKLEISHSQLRQLLDIFVIQSVNEDIKESELTTDKLLFALNEMNQIFPFFVNQAPKLESVSSKNESLQNIQSENQTAKDFANLLDEKAIFTLSLVYDSEKESINFNGKNYTTQQFYAFIEGLL